MQKMKLMLVIGLMVFLSSPVYSEELVLKELDAAVAETERAFAKTMVDRDFEGFKSFLSQEAIFISGERVLNGKQQIADAWEPYYQQELVPFSWEPDQVVVLDSGMLAHSSGPVLDPVGQRVATFNSIWRFDTKTKKWLIVFDKGNEFCNCAKP